MIDAGKLVPALATAAVVPAVSIIELAAVLPCCRSSTWLRGPVLLPMIDGGKLVPIIQGHGWQRCPWCPSCRSTAGNVVPIIDLAARCPCRPCRSSTLPRSCPVAAPRQPGSWCRSSRATGGNGRGPVADDRRREAGAGIATAAVVPAVSIIELAAVLPCCRSSTWLRGPVLLPMIDGGKLVPALATAAVVPVVPSRAGRADRRREAGADHPGPRVATVPVVPVVPIDSRERRAAPRQPGSWCPWCRVVPAVSIDGGKLLPIIDLAARSCPVADDRRRERRADHRPGCAVPVPAVSIIDLAAVLPCCRARQPGSWCRSSRATGGNGRGPVADDRRREAGAGIATAAVVPVVPSRAGRADRRREAGADHPGPRVATVPVVPVVPIDSRERRAALDNREAGARGAESCRPCRSTAGSCCRSSTLPRGPALLPMIDAGNVVPIIDLAARCPCRPCRSSTLPRSCPVAAPRQPGSWCRSSRATGGNGRGPVADDRRREAGAGARNGRRRARGAESCRPCRSTAGSWCRSSRATGGNGARGARRADRQPGTSCRARQPGSWCPWCRSSRATGGNGARGARRADRQPGTSCPWCRVVPAVSIDGGKLVPIIDLAARSCPVADDRRRERRADHRPGCGGARAGRVDHRPCRGPALLPRLDSREAGADHPGPRVATVPVVPVVPIDSRERRAAPRQPGSWCPWCRSSRATGGNGRRRAGRVDRRREAVADHRPCRAVLPCCR